MLIRVCGVRVRSTWRPWITGRSGWCGVCEVCRHLGRVASDYGFVVELRHADLRRAEEIHDAAQEALQAHRIAAHGVGS